jgi:hypothetical protein
MQGSILHVDDDPNETFFFEHAWSQLGSHEPADIQEAYHLGASAYFDKPTTIEGTQRLLELLNGFWSLAKLPELPGKC